jgi:valyl-tRNA synthetase
MPQLNIKDIESKWRKYWEDQKIYKFNPNSKKPIYSIDTPPPYASSGHLHVGHALHYTQFEIIARVKRLLNHEIYFAPGFDDNGLPTEKYVEEKLGINKSKTTRIEFRKLCLKESDKVEKEYTNSVFKKLGHSYDWSLLYQTISSKAQKISQLVFLKLIEKKDCYRKEEPTIWCPHHETALAQAEVEDLERTTKLNYINFNLINSKDEISIATTRPEFLPACVGIFIHPDDKRYKNLLNKEALVPIFNHKVKISADKKVDPNFGTGIVMVCTFGDNTDIEWWKKHNLDLISILNKNGTLNEKASLYQNQKLEEAKSNILEELKKQNKLTKQESLTQTLGSCWRCNTPVEYIVTKQWFIKTLSYKKDLIKNANKISWYPKFMQKRFEDWTNNLAWDWTISRQRYYGIPIPAWYCETCDTIILPKESELPIDPIEINKFCPKCKLKAIPETDVFDTWMTSSNSPELAAKWLENPKQYKKIAPMSLRPQSHDIIRTWAFYTILKSHLLFNRIPWENVMIGTFVLDPKGKGMHKSKGNAIWADELIDKYGIDAFRYWVGSASIGTDLPFKEQELIAGQKFLTKIYNASNFVFIHLDKYQKNKPNKLEKIDEWMLLKLNKTIEKVKILYESYNISGAKREIEHFFWHTFADNYLEIVKNRIYNTSGHQKESAQYTLYHSLLAILKMISPITPFITEEIYQTNFKKLEKEKSIHISNWPKVETTKNKDIETSGDIFINLLAKIRQAKSLAKKSMKALISLTLPKDTQIILSNFLKDFKSVTNSKIIKTGNFKIEIH